MSDLDDFFAKKDKTKRKQRKGLFGKDLDKKFESEFSILLINRQMTMNNKVLYAILCSLSRR